MKNEATFWQGWKPHIEFIMMCPHQGWPESQDNWGFPLPAVKLSSFLTGTTTQEPASFLIGVWFYQTILPPEISILAWNRFDFTVPSALSTNSYNIPHYMKSSPWILFTTEAHHWAHRHIIGSFTNISCLRGSQRLIRVNSLPALLNLRIVTFALLLFCSSRLCLNLLQN